MKTQVSFIPCDTDPVRSGNAELQFQKDWHGHPAILVLKNDKKEIFTTLLPLLEAVPELNTEKALPELSKIVNFLTKGDEFELISDPDSFKSQYKNEIDKELNCFDFNILTYGIFNVEEISHPKIVKEKSGDQLIFYVKKKIPYRVSCEFPVITGDIHYKILSQS